MVRLLYLVCLMILLPLYAKRIELDRICASINGEIIITKSELERPGLDGQMRSLDDLIQENLVYLDAKRMGAMPDEEAMQRHWEAIKKQNNLSEEDMRQIAAQGGYTLAEAKMQLGKMSAINQMIELKVKASLFVTKQEVERYYLDNPEIEQAEYEVARAFVPFNVGSSRDDLNNRLTLCAKTGQDDALLRWSQPFVLKHDEIAYDKQCIYTMKPDEISQPFELSQGFELFKLVHAIPARTVPLCERYDAIEYQLKILKYQELMNNYKKELYARATIAYF